jgi:metal-responsive CopG/Arc/MetJ family transcriptional regulator
MGNIKTAISIQERLFEQADALAREMNISRSRLFALALQEFIQRYQNQKLLDEINSAYKGELDPGEAIRLHSMRRRQRYLVEGEW